MPTLTVYKTITYTDPDSDTPYTITSTKVIECDSAQRLRFTLSTGANTQLLANNSSGLTTANPQYVAIKNVGSGSAYIMFSNPTAGSIEHEIPAGAIHDFFGEDIVSDSYGGSDETISTVHAKGNTELEVDVFM